MRFIGREDIIVAEMSKANNAMYLFETDAFESYVGELASARFNYHALKSKDYSEARWIHTGGWQYRFAERLVAYGVRPGRGW
jgi:hypothetical protein